MVMNAEQPKRCRTDLARIARASTARVFTRASLARTAPIARDIVRDARIIRALRSDVRFHRHVVITPRSLARTYARGEARRGVERARDTTRGRIDAQARARGHATRRGERASSELEIDCGRLGLRIELHS